MARQDDGYTFVLSDEVTRTPVRYENRFGVKIAADLYQSKDLDTTSTDPALVVGPPHGGVKEQGPGVYAQEMAHITSPEVLSSAAAAASRSQPPKSTSASVRWAPRRSTASAEATA